MKSNTNIAAITDEVTDLLNVCLKKENLTSKEWLPLLKKLRDTLQYSCRELDSYLPFNGDDYLQLKDLLVRRLLQNLNDVKDSTGIFQALESDEALLDRFDWLEDAIDDKQPLTRDDLYVVLYVLLSRFIERIQQNDFTEYYELSSLMGDGREDENLMDSFANSSKVPKKYSRKNGFTYKRLGWITFCRGQVMTKSELLKVYEVPSIDNLYNHRIKVKKLYESFDVKKSDRSWKNILVDLNFVIDFLKKENEPIAYKNALLYKEKALQEYGLPEES